MIRWVRIGSAFPGCKQSRRGSRKMTDAPPSLNLLIAAPRGFCAGVDRAIPIVEKITWGTATDEEKETYAFLDAVAFSTIRQLIGLDELDLAVTGAAASVPTSAVASLTRAASATAGAATASGSQVKSATGSSSPRSRSMHSK